MSLLAATMAGSNLTHPLAPIAFVQQVYSNTTANSSTHAITPSANTSTGNRLIMVMTVGNSRTVSSIVDTQGNTWAIDRESGGARSTVIMSAYLTTPLTTSDTITITLNAASPGDIIAGEFSGLIASPVDKFNSNTGSTVTTVSTGTTGTLTQANELAIIGICWNGNPGTISSEPSGYTGFTSPNVILKSGYRVVSATTALNESWTWATGRNTAAAIVTYRGNQ